MGTPGLVTALATRRLSDGTVTRLERGRRADAAARQDIARAAPTGLDVTAHPASYTVRPGLEPHRWPDHVAAALAEEGVLVSTADAFATGPHRPRALRPVPATPPPDELRDALHRPRGTIEAIPP
ncbi:hypothetical protein [Streptomyces sp. NK15101]|uniref:hypothetical protein n=1 Tax=Streptomyces sp. NK15101 TaxID=2873261 RepID=UPI001CED3AD1|nr:hypothetical protein [Streptomyces sp. NK15101]